MRILVTGAGGLLGSEVVWWAQRINEMNNGTAPEFEVLATTHQSLDVTDREAVLKSVREFKPDCIIHCAAYTAVDKAEDERERCYAVNVLATGYFVEAANEADCSLIYVSTEYIFDGAGDTPYETDSKPSPICYYGLTKQLGEQAVLEKCKKYYIARTSWTYGRNGNSFVKTMLRVAQSRSEVNVVTDQIGSPTYVSDVAKRLLELAGSGKYGIYHLVNSGYCSRYEMTVFLYKLMNINITVKPIDSSEYIAKARRPLNCRLSQKSFDIAGLEPMRSWDDALTEFCREYGKDILG